jgi:hypothetical protein
MPVARSTKRLTEDLARVLPSQPAPQPLHGAGPADAAAGAQPPRPVAIVGVHGISPIQQYGFQDQLATGMLSYLNAVEASRNSGRTWAATSYWPRVAQGPNDPDIKPSALRLHRDDEPAPDNPTTQVYDVYEGYWSPYSKGKTNIASLLNWLLSITFLATSSTARIPASWRKLSFDVGYLLGALFLVVLFLAGGVLAGTIAWSGFLELFSVSGPAAPSFLDLATNPLGHLAVVPWYGWLQLALDVVVAYLIVQLFIVFRTRIKTHTRTVEMRNDGRTGGRFEHQTIEASVFHRVTATVLLVFVVVLGLVDWWLLKTYHPDNMLLVLWHGAWLVAAVGLIQFARGIADFVVVDVLGDVQIYCTHDTNSAFYAIRGQIVDAVTKALMGALSAIDVTRVVPDDSGPAPLYAKVHVAGHSLGTTVALDVLIRIRQLFFEHAVPESSWGRIRSFTTFGTALEKTRFFLDVRNATLSAAQQQWQNDVYGQYFTLDRNTLAAPDNANGIFWSNHWYARDIVANRIVSYESDVNPGAPLHSYLTATGAHPICEDNRIPHPKPPWAFVHGDYIGDALFWKNVGPVFTS